MQALSSESPLAPADTPPVRPIRELLTLALPTIAQMASYTVMQFADTLQLAMGAGDTAATAAGMAGFMVFAAMSWGWGAILVVNTLVSQSIGAGNQHAAGRYMWQGVWFALVVGVLLLPTSLFSAAALRAFGHSPDVVRYGQQYYNIEILWSPLRLAGLAVGQFLLAIGKPRVTLIAAVIAATTDVLMNYVFITGRFGMPALGVAGAAWSTNAAVTLELAIMVAYCSRRWIRETYQVWRWRFHRAAMGQLVRLGVPGGFQIVAEVVAWLLFCVWIMNRFGQSAVVANNYMMQYMKVSFMPAFGLSAAVTALVGRYLGMGRLDLARQRAHLGFKVAATYMLACGAVFFLGRNTFIGLFSADPDVIRVGGILLTFAAIYQLFDALYIIYIGALRGVGDTFWPAWVTGVLCWTIVVGGGALVGYAAPQWGPTGPWVMASAYGLILGTYLVLRFSRGEWKAMETAVALPPEDRPGRGQRRDIPSNEIDASTTVEVA
jgi:MATE family multidrug resistance protein